MISLTKDTGKLLTPMFLTNFATVKSSMAFQVSVTGNFSYNM